MEELIRIYINSETFDQIINEALSKKTLKGKILSSEVEFSVAFLGMDENDRYYVELRQVLL